MSADLWIDRRHGHELNVTYNLSKMLSEAGFNGWSWCLDKPAPEVGKHMLEVLDGMRENEDRWRAMNPANGWGDYDTCLQGRMREFAETCVETPSRYLVGGCL